MKKGEFKTNFHHYPASFSPLSLFSPSFPFCSFLLFFIPSPISFPSPSFSFLPSLSFLPPSFIFLPSLFSPLPLSFFSSPSLSFLPFFFFSPLLSFFFFLFPSFFSPYLFLPSPSLSFLLPLSFPSSLSISPCISAHHLNKYDNSFSYTSQCPDGGRHGARKAESVRISRSNDEYIGRVWLQIVDNECLFRHGIRCNHPALKNVDSNVDV